MTDGIAFELRLQPASTYKLFAFTALLGKLPGLKFAIIFSSYMHVTLCLLLSTKKKMDKERNVRRKTRCWRARSNNVIEHDAQTAELTPAEPTAELGEIWLANQTALPQRFSSCCENLLSAPLVLPRGIKMLNVAQTCPVEII